MAENYDELLRQLSESDQRIEEYKTRLEEAEQKRVELELENERLSNINQVSKRANETGTVYEKDVLDLRTEIDCIIPLVVEAHKNTVKLRGL